MEIPSEQPRDAERGRAITEAAQAAAAGDAPGMLAALHTSGFTDGLVRRLGHRFPKLPRDEVDASVAAAADSFYAALRAGRHVVTPAAWLWKAAFNEARDRWCNTFKDLDPSGSEHLDRVPAPDPADRLELEAQPEQRQRAALTAARRLIPQCGEGQVIAVLDLLLTAVENGIQDLPAAEIAAALGISPSAARSLLARGLDRLAKRARAAGITLPEDLPGEAELADPVDAENVE